MDCMEITARLEQYVDRELSSDEAAEVQAHLDECPPCLRVYQFEHGMRRLVRRACSESAPPSLIARILKAGPRAEPS
jgi:mycothiol system anti-sigma-R factor